MKKALGAVGAIAVFILIYAGMRPDTFHVERSTSIKAPAEKIQPLLADFHKWGSWSPWEKLDPDMKRTFSGPEKGKGARYAWEGNSEVGKGRMEILDSTPEKVTIQLDFLEPMEGSSLTTFSLASRNGETAVSWRMEGPMNYLSKVIGVFCSMDKMIGKDFEKGLASMKAVAEK